MEAAISIVALILTVLGSLGVFLLGMKLISEALQKVAGERLKSLLAKMTSNRFSGVLTGLAVTGVLQSSSATTVIVVSFVSAGLFTLTQAISVIMGANIGTTVTGWIVALVGFKMEITLFALPAIAFGVFMSFMKHVKIKLWGEVLVGFGILFLGLSLMKDSIPTISNPEQLAWLKHFSGGGLWSTLAFVLFGTVITAILQSSSATMTMTLTLAAMGWLPYSAAAALVLGENIGTTATANLAAIGAPPVAKRAALAHLFFNVFGVIWAVALMNIYWLPMVDWLVPGDPTVDFNTIQGDPAALALAAGVVSTHLAAAHTLFNVTNTAIMLPFVRQLERLVTRIVPETDDEAPARARFLDPSRIGSAEINVVQVSKAMQHMISLVRNMLKDAFYIVAHPHDDLGKMVEKTLGIEREVDQLEQEVLSYLAALGQMPVSEATSRKLSDLVQNTHRLERIGDHCAVIVRIARRIHSAGTPFSEEAIEDTHRLYEQVDRSLEHVSAFISGSGSITVGEEIEDRIDSTRRKLRGKYVQKMEQEGAQRAQCLAVLDTITHLEEIGDRAVGIIRRA
ncbi:MAG TPA: Na/Pi cotransporter family protein [Polyangiaceae bacterium]|nr:MAG: Na+/Pi-cotransporter [Deltaproteobacteria bacterium ADurb.Bin207]HNS99012.1 Na/Pi cotransporter family protein [Polyangiaceae bacterium]HNZ23128.1 Na/Pi cotransporter family protein [Polyangiaceae bacterium]HOD22141.1 Na/Pi cotransporter family protein [Polyangiaceae bacterium]HOE49409.1 Na/Pi cotransporter family protein [Polyangiaceae bacterium]